MPLIQALALSVGLAVLVFGCLYFIWRSGGDDRTASSLRALLAAVSASLMLAAGTSLLLSGWPNIPIALAWAILCYACAFKTSLLWRKPITVSLTTVRVLRLYSSANLVAAILCATGCVFLGGPFGILGAFASVYWIVLHGWLLKRLAES